MLPLLQELFTSQRNSHNLQHGSSKGVALPCTTEPSQSLPFCNTRLSIEQRVDDLVARLTLQEKAQQLQNSATEMQSVGLPGEFSAQQAIDQNASTSLSAVVSLLSN